MASISNLGTITVARGDCFRAPLFINIGTEKEPIRLDVRKLPELEIYFGVYMPYDRFENSFIAKKFDHLDSNELGDIMITINLEDTLYIRPGSYKYSVRARMYDESYGEWINTVVDANTFYIN